MARYEPGQPKPPGSGRKKGTPNKATLALRERLAAHGCDFEEELAKAIMAKDYAMVQVLQSLLPFIQPKFKDREPVQEKTNNVDDSLSSFSTEELINFVRCNQ